VGVFLAEHFWSNSGVYVSAANYDEMTQGLETSPSRSITEAVVGIRGVGLHRQAILGWLVG